jgi:hypothetical protein
MEHELSEMVRVALPDAGGSGRLDHRPEIREVDPIHALDQNAGASRKGLLLVPREDLGDG